MGRRARLAARPGNPAAARARTRRDPMIGGRSAQRMLSWRFRLARVALIWERAWPALWPVLFVLGLFAAAALFDVLPALPGEAHAGVLAAFAIALAAAGWWGW